MKKVEKNTETKLAELVKRVQKIEEKIETELTELRKRVSEIESARLVGKH